MAKQDKTTLYTFTIIAQGMEGYETFRHVDENDELDIVLVPFNEPYTTDKEWLYDAFKRSQWNPKRIKTRAEKRADENKGMVCERSV